MTRLNGVSGEEAWAWLPEDQRESVLAQVGEIVAEVQRVPVGDLSSAPASMGAIHSPSKSKDAAPSMNAWACRKDIWTGWTISFGMPRRSFP
jgi:hypothetical protein